MIRIMRVGGGRNYQAYIFIIKPTRCTNFTNLFWHETLHVSGISSAQHQEFIHCTLGTGICHTGLKTAFEQDQSGPARKLSTNLTRTKTCGMWIVELKSMKGINS